MSVSVVIPVYKDDAALEKLLTYLIKTDINEIIVSDAEERANLPELFDKFPMTYVRSERGRGPQIQAGIDAATQPFIWVLHADTIPPQNGAIIIRRSFRDPNLALLTFTLIFDKPSLWLSLFSLLARWESAISTFGDQGFAFRKVDFENLSIDLNAYPLMEDVALRQALKKRGRVKRAPLKIITSSRRFQSHGIFKTQTLNLILLMRYAFGASPSELFRAYYADSASQE